MVRVKGISAAVGLHMGDGMLSVYIPLRKTKTVRTIDLKGGLVNVDVDAGGNVVGLEIIELFLKSDLWEKLGGVKW